MRMKRIQGELEAYMTPTFDPQLSRLLDHVQSFLDEIEEQVKHAPDRSQEIRQAAPA